jgi:hypothetical protein
MAKHGPIPPGLCVLHRCDVRPCINPDHLFLGTQKDNMADLAAKRGHERRPHDGGPEWRPSKAPEIMRIRMYGHEFVTRVLAVRPMAGVSGRAPPMGTQRKKPVEHATDTADAQSVIVKPIHRRRARGSETVKMEEVA